jgi:hypothetical protein
VKRVLVQVRESHVVKSGHRTKTNFQEVVALRGRGWEGLPPPPVSTTSKPGADQKDPAAIPVTTSLGLPNRDIEPVVTPEADTTPGSPVTQSPSISIAALSDFTIADTSDDELPPSTP